MAIETSAPRTLIVEVGSGAPLFEKGVDDPFQPGNFAKLMTAALVFDALKNGVITESTAYVVTEDAWRRGGAPARVTTMFVPPGDEATVGDLLKGLTVQYANDAAIALAEGLAGSETVFAQRMNAKAEALGMTATRFVNATGFADERARITLADLSRLVSHLQRDHADRYGLYGLAEFAYGGVTQRNKTTFVHDGKGIDGLALAFDETAGFSGALSAMRDGRRVNVLASGFRKANDRDAGMKALVDAAYAEFALVPLFPAGAEVARIRVFGGERSRIAVTGDGPVAITLPSGERDGFRLRVVYDGPVPAPVRRGDPVAALEVRRNDRLYQTVPLVAAEDVGPGDLWSRARDGALELLLGWW